MLRLVALAVADAFGAQVADTVIQRVIGEDPNAGAKVSLHLINAGCRFT